MTNKGDEVTQGFKSKFLGDAEWMIHPLLHAIPAELLADNPIALHNYHLLKSIQKQYLHA